MNIGVPHKEENFLPKFLGCCLIHGYGYDVTENVGWILVLTVFGDSHPPPTAVLLSKISVLEIHIVLMIHVTVYCVRQVETFVEKFCLYLQGRKLKTPDTHRNRCQTGLSACEITRRHV
jgi:hypothetical protein